MRALRMACSSTPGHRIALECFAVCCINPQAKEHNDTVLMGIIL